MPLPSDARRRRIAFSKAQSHRPYCHELTMSDIVLLAADYYDRNRRRLETLRQLLSAANLATENGASSAWGRIMRNLKILLAIKAIAS